MGPSTGIYPSPILSRVREWSNPNQNLLTTSLVSLLNPLDHATNTPGAKSIAIPPNHDFPLEVSAKSIIVLKEYGLSQSPPHLAYRYAMIIGLLQPLFAPERILPFLEPRTTNRPPPVFITAIHLLAFLSHSSGRRWSPSIPPYYTLFPENTFITLILQMEDMLTNLWNNLSLSENEATTIFIDLEKLSAPINALAGKLAMKKNISIFEIEKSLRVIWNVANRMEATLLGENLFMFSFHEARDCDRIIAKQPWNYRGSILLLDRIRGDECPSELALMEVPFWIQTHDLQLRAMNKRAGEEIGALIGWVIDVCCDA